ncbi:GTPase-activating protein gyp8 [Microbotryomycetes sp. JL221]|nr:GTPase-activating protein gyp8 [Microbotryomycetes sp. JL221]
MSSPQAIASRASTSVHPTTRQPTPSSSSTSTLATVSSLSPPGTRTGQMMHTTLDDMPERNLNDQVFKAVKHDDWHALRRLATEPGGFERNELRRVAWPHLLGCKGKHKATPINDDTLPTHPDERQVHLDVIRSFVSYPTDISDNDKDQLRSKLEYIIVTTLRKYPTLQYFQGLHDIATVLLLVLEDEHTALEATERMCLHRIRDNMGTGLEPVMGYLRLVRRILQHVDPHLATLVDSAAELPYFSLSWVLTLMSHDLTSLNVISRLFDFLLAFNPAMISYVGAAIVLMKREALLELDKDALDDPATLHHALSQLPNFVEPNRKKSSTSSVKSRSKANPLSLSPQSKDGQSHVANVSEQRQKLIPAISNDNKDENAALSSSWSISSITSSTSGLLSRSTSATSLSTLDGGVTTMKTSTIANSSATQELNDDSNDSFIRNDTQLEQTHPFSNLSSDDVSMSNSSMLDVLDDSMLSDPDVVNLVFETHDKKFERQQQRVQDEKDVKQQRSMMNSMSEEETWQIEDSDDDSDDDDDDSMRRQNEPPVMSIEELINKALELWNKFPLLNDDTNESLKNLNKEMRIEILKQENKQSCSNSIKANEIMGTQSCIFTWFKSIENKLTNDQAHDIAIKSKSDLNLIVLPSFEQQNEEQISTESNQIKDENKRLSKPIKRKQNKDRLKTNIGSSLIVFGIVGVVLALYGQEIKTFVSDSVKSTTSTSSVGVVGSKWFKSWN